MTSTVRTYGVAGVGFATARSHAAWAAQELAPPHVGPTTDPSIRYVVEVFKQMAERLAEIDEGSRDE
jgi:hypothetical protein